MRMEMGCEMGWRIGWWEGCRRDRPRLCVACTWPRAGCTACSMCEGTILGLETTARYRPENPYQPARRQWGWRQAPPSAIPSDRSHLEPLHEQSGAPALFALRESPVGRMAPSPFDITSVAVQPMDCRRSEVPIVLQSKTRSGNTAIRRQNVIN